MSKVQMLNALVKQRLTAAAEEIFGLFERTIAEYEEELCRSKEENERRRNLLDAVFNPHLRLHRTDVQQLSVSKEQVPPEQWDWSPSLDQQHPEPPHIKEEQQELWVSQEREQLQGLEEADSSKFPFTPVHVKSEDDEEKPQPSLLHQRQTEQMEGEADGEDWGGPEPAKNSDPDRHPEPKTDDQTGDSSEPETDDSEDQEDTAKAQSNLKSLKKDDVPVSDTQSSTGKKEFSCSKCTKRFGLKSSLKRHMRTHTVKKCCSCSVCNKGFQMKSHLQRHMIIHTGEKAFSCSVCEKRFGYKATLQQHMATHTGEKRLRCSVCDQRFTWHSQLRKHRAVCCKPSRLRRRQTERMEREANREDRGGPGPARKSEPRRYSEPKTDDQTGDSSEPETDDSEDQEETIEAQSGLMSLGKDEVPVSETRCRTGTKEFSCSKCTKRFGFKSFLKRHMRTHLEEKLVHCPVCKRGFRREIHLQGHMITHTGEKPFRCSVCKQCFAWSCNLKRHMRTHRGSKRVHCRV
ncbi:zinc finger protein 236-like isoform X3 [Etheostoma cragini]|uniref:zinc finger protein 236-like isoform X3 n=1 Tax=Etheostoma cragini TaxID=417921 RepID=UPI00155EDFAC|nr:zinc finger protein 236-like isoform X3 [Etheostoma cragini]